MRKPNKDINLAKVGMDKENHPSNMGEQSYHYALNSNIQDQTNNSFSLQNEQSNLLCSKFKDGFKVIGFLKDIDEDKVYFFLTNPLTKTSEIGYIDRNNCVKQVEDIEVNCNCDIKKLLSEGLENTEQIPYCNYVTLLEDSCNKCLGFDVNNPIYSPVIKNEKCGKTIYWTDGVQPQRSLELDNLGKYREIGYKSCDTDELVDTCLDCNKLNIFPNFTKPCIEVEQITTTGNLREGTYEFVIYYTDELGNRLSDSVSKTNPVKIFDERNINRTQPEDLLRTNKGIKLTITNLDSNNFRYYRIGVIFKDSVSNTARLFLEENTSTEVNEKLITTELNKEGTSFNELFEVLTRYKASEGFASANGILFQYGLTSYPEINLQPVVNLMGVMAEWVTVRYQGDIHADPVLAEKYASYQRDETQPFSIRFTTDDGRCTANFPFISRPPTDYDLELVDNNDTQSVNEYLKDCEKGRDKRWQFYNTAEVEGSCEGEPLEFEEITEVQSFTCEDSSVSDLSGVSITITDKFYYEYGSFEEYVNANRERICDPTSPIYNSDLCDLITDTGLNTCDNGEENCGDGDDNLISENEYYIIDGVSSITETTNFTQVQEIDDSNLDCGQLPDSPTTDSSFPTLSVLERNEPDNISCSNVYSIVDSAFPRLATWFNYRTSATETDLHTSLVTTCPHTSSVSTSPLNINSDALFFNVNTSGADSIIVNFNELFGCQIDDLTNTDVRISIYDGCPDASSVAVSCSTEDLSSSTILIINPNDYPSGKAYIIIDSPIQSDGALFYTDSPCGCITAALLDTDIESIDITTGDIQVTYRREYTKECTIQVPIFNSCIPELDKRGKFAYVESTETYPDNKQLYNSSTLRIPKSVIDNLESRFFDKFYNAYVEEVTYDEYILNSETDFRCKPIRHFKFPCNQICPFISNLQGCNTEPIFYPIGFSISTDVINTFLDIAVTNGLITRGQRNSIVGYEIFKGDRAVDKSIITSGYLYDMYKYNERGSGDETWYPNYPYNPLGNDVLHFSDESRRPVIGHPFGGTSNNRYTFHSPEIHFDRTTVPNEMKVNGVMYGCGQGHFVRLDEHPQWEVLTRAAFGWADSLALLELISSGVINAADIVSNNPISGVAGAIIYGVGFVVESLYTYFQYRNQWLETFRNLSPRHNYARYFTSTACYDKFEPLGDTSIGNSLRGVCHTEFIEEGRVSVREGNREVRINNFGREDSQYIGLGDYPLDYNTFRIGAYDLFGYDRSRFVMSQTPQGSICTESAISPSVDFNVASLYVTMKQFKPSQYGALSTVTWLSTGHCGRLDMSNSCNPIFGGDIYFSWLTLKRKIPLFVRTALGLSSSTGFSYEIYSNIAYPRFYMDYLSTLDDGAEITGTFNGVDTGGGAFGNGQNFNFFFPKPRYVTETDCEDEKAGVFNLNVSPRAAFYTHYYGIPKLPVESSINLNFRLAGVDKSKDFYPNYSDYIDWTQESVVPIKEKNYYWINRTYNEYPTLVPTTKLPSVFDQSEFDCRLDAPNGVIYSEQDNSENSFTDPWRSYKPLNKFEFPQQLGKLVDIVGLSSGQLLSRFENGFQIDNPYDRLAQSLIPDNERLGNQGIFQKRPISFTNTELGYGGTQHKAIVRCEYGAFWVDAKRGQVFSISQSGENFTEISSRNTSGQPTNMRNWFKQQLPFKILNGGINNLLDTDVDNPYNGLGISMGWDSRYQRVFLTKKDYKVKPEYKGKLFYRNKKFYLNGLPISLSNENVFEPCHWTLAYSPVMGKWISEYSFTPDYYIPYDNYFQTGLNTSKNDTENGLWSHLITNRSYQVFYGKLHPWIIVPIHKETYINKVFNSYEYWLDTKRYHNEYDFAEHRDKGFNKAIVYNHSNNSGLMELILAKTNDLSQQIKYPQHLKDRTQILVTENDKKWTFNMAHNRVFNELNNVPIWLTDCSNLDQSLNNKAIDYSSSYKDRLRGDWFLVKLIQDIYSNYKMVYKFGFENSVIYA